MLLSEKLMVTPLASESESSLETRSVRKTAKPLANLLGLYLGQVLAIESAIQMASWLALELATE